jgi:hypothetical protein
MLVQLIVVNVLKLLFSIILIIKKKQEVLIELVWIVQMVVIYGKDMMVLLINLIKNVIVPDPTKVVINYIINT